MMITFFAMRARDLLALVRWHEITTSVFRAVLSSWVFRHYLAPSTSWSGSRCRGAAQAFQYQGCRRGIVPTRGAFEGGDHLTMPSVLLLCVAHIYFIWTVIWYACRNCQDIDGLWVSLPYNLNIGPMEIEIWLFHIDLAGGGPWCL